MNETHSLLHVFDARILMEQTLDDTELFTEVMNAFLADLPIHLDHITTGMASGEQTLAYRAAHSLKGAAANVGAGELAQLSAQLEHLLKDDITTAETQALGVQIGHAMDRLREQLDTLGL
ncbi:MAG: Hpt domain-containing protein [Methylococcaceae bacterium]